MDIEKTTPMCFKEHIKDDNVLFKASMPDEDIAAWEAGNWEPASNAEYLLYEDKAVVRLDPISNMAVCIHPHLKSKYWGTGESHKLEEAIEEWIKKNTLYCKLVVMTPQCCREVLQAATREGYELEGILTAAIFWRNKIENLVLMSKFINRGSVNE